MTWLRRYFRRRQVSRARDVALSADGARMLAGQREAEDGRHIRAVRL